MSVLKIIKWNRRRKEMLLLSCQICLPQAPTHGNQEKCPGALRRAVHVALAQSAPLPGMLTEVSCEILMAGCELQWAPGEPCEVCLHKKISKCKASFTRFGFDVMAWTPTGVLHSKKLYYCPFPTGLENQKPHTLFIRPSHNYSSGTWNHLKIKTAS